MIAVSPVASVPGVIPPMMTPPAPPTTPSAPSVGTSPTRANVAQCAQHAANGTLMRVGPSAQIAKAVWAITGPTALTRSANAGASASAVPGPSSSNSKQGIVMNRPDLRGASFNFSFLTTPAQASLPAATTTTATAAAAAQQALGHAQVPPPALPPPPTNQLAGPWLRGSSCYPPLSPCSFLPLPLFLCGVVLPPV